MTFAFVVAARPNYMKIAPILAEWARRAAVAPMPAAMLVHTGQHVSASMSDAFFRDLGMREPDECLGVGGDTHAVQTARVMIGFDEICDRRKPDAVVVAGDVNSTLACALVASKRGVKIAHVEAGLRSFDRSMPEEINRVLTDQISDLLLTTSEEAQLNLEREGVDASKVRLVGNPMIDSLTSAIALLPAHSKWARDGAAYTVATLHRPANVDESHQLRAILDGLRAAAKHAPVLLPAHPRTANALAEFGLTIEPYDERRPLPPAGLFQLPPLGYLDFLDLLRAARCVVTDSGGVQEETTVLGIPCATLRATTERPVTITLGTNELVAPSAAAIERAVCRALGGHWKRGTIPPLWDGRAAPRIVDGLLELAAR